LLLKYILGKNFPQNKKGLPAKKWQSFSFAEMENQKQRQE
jgi:hypothetical protein